MAEWNLRFSATDRQRLRDRLRELKAEGAALHWNPEEHPELGDEELEPDAPEE